MKRLLHVWLLPILFLSFVQQATAQDPPQYGQHFNNIPDTRDINMYQVNIRAFSAAGNLAGVTARLDSIKSLHINTIYLLPIYPVGTDPKSANSPYCIKDFKSVGAEYGTLSDLRTLVASAHKKGMAVILDWVVNQTSWDNPWITEHPDWYVRNANGVIQQLDSYTDVAALDMTNPNVEKAMVTDMRYWIFSANVDGFRCDYADHPPVSFWQQTISNLRSIRSHKLIMLAEGARSGNFTAGFDMNFGFNFYGNIIAVHNGSSVAKIQISNDQEYVGANWSQQVARYTGNHDTNGSGTPLEVFGGQAGVMANFVVAAYMKGVPFLYNGQEVAFAPRIPFPWNTVHIDWTPKPDVTNEFRKVLALRSNSVAIRRGKLLNYSDVNVCAFTKTFAFEQVLVFSNLRGTTSKYIIPPALAGTYKDEFTGAKRMLKALDTLSLDGYQYLALGDRSRPESWLISVSPLNSSVTVGTTLPVTAKVLFSRTRRFIKWTSSNTGIASVNDTGLVTAVAVGTATITAALDRWSKATSLVTVVPQHNFTVHFFKPADWAAGINIYWYNVDPPGSLPTLNWPGTPMTNDGDGWYSYSFKNVNSAVVIFNDGSRQSADLPRDKDGWYSNGVWYDSKPATSTNSFTVHFYKPADFGTPINIYWYNALPDGSYPSVAWPGVAMTNEGDGWYSYTFNNVASAVVIFNDGTKQSADLPRSTTGWYLNGVWYDTKPATQSTNTFTVSFYRPSTWGTNINIYWYNAVPDGSLPSPSWPGVPMTNNGDGWYTYTFSSATAATLIFNDGTNQSADTYRDKNGWYKDGAWYDTKPATPDVTWTVNFHRPATWGTGINIYWYNALPDGSLPSPSWPGVAMTDNGGDWYSYTFTNIASAVVIFNDGSNQSADLPRSTTGWYLDGVWYDTKPATLTAAASNSNIISGKAFSIVQVYPNPSTQYGFTVIVPGLIANERATLSVIDASGRIMLRKEVSESSKIGDNLRPGVYLIRIDTKEMHTTKKVVVQ